MFRTLILKAQGWPLQRVLSPAVFRDARGSVQMLAQRAREIAAQATEPGALRTGGSL